METISADKLRPEWAATGGSGTWQWDLETNLLHADAKFAELYGLDPQTALAGIKTQAFFSAIHPEDRPRIQIAVAAILEGLENFSKEFRVVKPNGQTVWMHGRGQCQFDEQEVPVRFTGVLIDITDRKRTEERLRIAQTAGGVGTFEYIDGYATVSVSQEFCRLLGLHPAKVLPSRTINGVLTAGQQPLIPAPNETQSPTTLDGTFQVQRNDDGELRWIERRGEILKEGSGYRLVGVIYDVTGAKQLEAELRELNDTLEARVEAEITSRLAAEDALRQAQKMEAVGQLTGGIAHDFNNLLMGISSSLDLLLKRIPDDPHMIRLIENGLQGVQRGAALTQRMLAFARRQDLTSELVNVDELIDGILDMTQRTLGASWPIEVDLPSDLPSILADRIQLEMALLNLAVNARDAMPGGGTIRITADRQLVAVGAHPRLKPGPYLRLCVIDAGTGMDAETLARAAEPFFTTKSVGKGTGLGLSMIHGLAHQLDGDFTLHSEIGMGTTASLWLPAAETRTPTKAIENPIEQPAAEQPGGGQALKILAVDDDPLILMNTAALLEDLGHQVVEASSSEEALTLFEKNPDFDLLITDHAMPGMTGAQLIEQIEKLRPNLPLILATGYGDLPANLRPNMIKLGKPFSPQRLSEAVAEAMSRFH